MKIVRLARRTLFLLSYNLYAKKRMRREDTVSLLGFTLRVPPGVFHPTLFFSSRYLAEYLLTFDLEGRAVLDVGCGSGILSLAAAARGAHVLAIDINPDAVAATRRNAEDNQLAGHIRAMPGDLLHSIPPGDLFDLIVWNPPYYPQPVTDPASHAWNAGPGYEVIAHAAATAGQHLAPGGRILLVLSSDADVGRILGFFQDYRFTPTLLQSRKKWFETFLIYELSLATTPSPVRP